MVLWGKQNEPPVPEILQGKTPEQIADALKRYEEMEKQLKQFADERTAMDARFNEQKTQFDTMQAKLTQMEQAAAVPPPPVDDTSIWADPDKYIANKLNVAQQPALYSGMLTAKMYAMNQLGPRDKKIFTKYEKEIDKMAESLTPQQRVMPQSWMMLLTMAKGQHDVEISNAERDHTDFFSESGQTGVQPPPTEPPPDKLTDDEETVCRVMHWDREAYQREKKGAQLRQSDRGGYMHFGTENIEANRRAR